MAQPRIGLETFFSNVGAFNDNPWSPVKRGALAFMGILSLELLFKAPWAFDSDWEVRPWSVVDPDDETATAVPWWMVPIGGFVVASVFV